VSGYAARGQRRGQRVNARREACGHEGHLRGLEIVIEAR